MLMAADPDAFGGPKYDDVFAAPRLGGGTDLDGTRVAPVDNGVSSAVRLGIRRLLGSRSSSSL